MKNIDDGLYIHSHAIVEDGAQLGAGTRIWAFSHVLAGARIGKDCNICDHTFIENEVHLGDRVTIKCGVYLWDGIELQDDAFIGPCVAFTNDKFPRSKQYLEQYAKTVVCKGASIGANATILPGLKIGSRSMVGAGAVVTRDVPANAIVVGNPAHIVGYMDTPSQKTAQQGEISSHARSAVEGVQFHYMKHVKDLRGDLCVAAWNKDIPFTPVRTFFVYNVPSARIRGEHAHKTCHQFLVCVKGSLKVVVDDGRAREESVLNRPWIGLHLPPKIWSTQYQYSQDAVLMVFASHLYDEDDYIRDYDKFLEYVGANA